MIVVLPFNSEDAQRAERLLDCCYWISGRKAAGHCLLVASPDVHSEYKAKVRLTAELAFLSVDLIELPVSGENKQQKINNVFRQAARYVKDCYKNPFLWLEADNVPLKPTWLKELFNTYTKQPRRYLGRFMQAKSGQFLSRTAIYPPDAIDDLEAHCSGQPPFERVANLMPRCTNTKLIDMQKWNPEVGLPEGAVLKNGDRTGTLIEKLIEESPEPKVATRRKVRA
jgi:hypothetical protein